MMERHTVQATREGTKRKREKDFVVVVVCAIWQALMSWFTKREMPASHLLYFFFPFFFDFVKI